jgi:hypothetical protein
MRHHGLGWPTREDVAAQKVIRACSARGHDVPDGPLRPTGSSTGPDGVTHHVRRVSCRVCGAVCVTRWRQPGGGGRSFVAFGAFEAPEPGNVPGLAGLVARLTDAEYAAAVGEAGLTGPPPDAAPDRRETAEAVTVDLAVSVRSGQFYLLDRHAELYAIMPVPPRADGAGLADARPGAAVLWTPVRTGDIRLAVTVAPRDPGAGDGGHDTVEVAFPRTTGHVRIQGLGGAARALPPLPAGYADYRLRYQVRDADDPEHAAHVLQIWPEGWRRPVLVEGTSRWGRARQAAAFTL